MLASLRSGLNTEQAPLSHRMHHHQVALGCLKGHIDIEPGEISFVYREGV